MPTITSATPNSSEPVLLPSQYNSNSQTSNGISEFLARLQEVHGADTTPQSIIPIEEALARLQIAQLQNSSINAALGDAASGNGGSNTGGQSFPEGVPSVGSDFLAIAGDLLGNSNLPAGIDPLQAAYAIQAAATGQTAQQPSSNNAAAAYAPQALPSGALLQPAAQETPSTAPTASAKSTEQSIDAAARYWEGTQPVSSQHLVSMRSALAHYGRVVNETT